MSIGVNEIRNLGEPIKQYNFDLVIPNIPNTQGVNSQILRIKTNSCSGIPGFGVEETASTQYGFTTPFAGKGVFPQTFSVVYEETLDLRITKTLRAWYNLMWDINTGAQAPALSYKTEAILRILNTTKIPVATIKFRGFFLQNVDDSGLDGNSSEAVTVSAAFKYSDWLFL